MGCNDLLSDPNDTPAPYYGAIANARIDELRNELSDTLHELNNTRAQLDWAEKELLESEENRRNLSDAYKTLQEMNRQAGEALIALRVKYDGMREVAQRLALIL